MGPKVNPAKDKKTCSTKVDVRSLVSRDALKGYGATFGAGYVSGIAGEVCALYMNGNLNASGITNPNFRDLCTISGVQQVAKEFSKKVLRLCPYMSNLATTNPFLFGAASGAPMWFLTRAVATPLTNMRKKDPKPFDGFGKSFVNDVAYHTIKNGIDEYCAVRVFPEILPKISSPITRRLVEGAIAGTVGAGSYTLAWPYKQIVAGQTVDKAWELTIRSFPKVMTKKISFVLSKPQFLRLLK